MIEQLSDEAIKKVVAKECLVDVDVEDMDRVIAQEAHNNCLKKVVEWGEELCKDRGHSGDMPKRQCGFCWQELKKQAEEK